MSKNDLLSKILYEAKSYNSIDDIEKMVEFGTDLSVIPIQPLYMSLKMTSTDQVAELIPKLSSVQRQVMLDLDLWKKDQVDVDAFEFWIEAYSKVDNDDIIQGFVTSEDFYLYLKSRVNVYTFDVEDPYYPDDDNYFLTDDMLLLIEYSSEYKYPNELKYLIKHIYAKFGVENAYSLLFKLVNDSYSELEEQMYQFKKERLRDYGFVDYYEAIEKLHPFISEKQILSFLKNKKTITPNLDLNSQNQSLHKSSIVSFDSEMDNIIKELSYITDEKRLIYLHFTFIRLINSTIVIHDALKSSRVELTRIGKYTKNSLELGLQFAKANLSLAENESLFEKFDFFDLYKIGNALIMIQRDRLKKALKKTLFETEDYEYFLGASWNTFLENSDNEIPKVKAYGAGLNAKEVNNLVVYEFWKNEISLFTNSLPFINTFFETFNKLKTDGKLFDSFYLNYEVENIDFESILISSFINHSLGNYSNSDVNKMGVTISELKSFFKLYFTKKNEDSEYVLLPLKSDKVKESIEKFIKNFGFNMIDNFENYLYGVLSEHLSGYEFDTLADEDFKHIGGPILLNSLPNN